MSADCLLSESSHRELGRQRGAQEGEKVSRKWSSWFWPLGSGAGEAPGMFAQGGGQDTEELCADGQAGRGWGLSGQCAQWAAPKVFGKTGWAPVPGQILPVLVLWERLVRVGVRTDLCRRHRSGLAAQRNVPGPRQDLRPPCFPMAFTVLLFLFFSELFFGAFREA